MSLLCYLMARESGADWNESRLSHKHFDELLLLARAELDTQKRAELYAEMQQICHDDGGTVMPLFRNRVMARRDNIMHHG